MKILERLGSAILIFMILAGQLFAATQFGNFLATGSLASVWATFMIELTVIVLSYILIKL